MRRPGGRRSALEIEVAERDLGGGHGRARDEAHDRLDGPRAVQGVGFVIEDRGGLRDVGV